MNPYDVTQVPTGSDAVTPCHSALTPFRPDVACAFWFAGVFCVNVAFLLAHSLCSGEVTLSAEPLIWLFLSAGVYHRLRLVRYGILLVSPLYMVASVVLPALWVTGRLDASLRIGGAHYLSPSPWLCLVYGVVLFTVFAYPFWVLLPRRVAVLFRIPR